MTEPFKVIYADPPWSWNDKLPGPGRGSEKHYKVLGLPDVMRFPLPPIADDAHLFLWRVASQVEEAYQVVRAWGFVPKAEIVWRKVGESGKLAFGMGRQVRMAHESCVIAVRGRPKVKSRSVRSVFDAPRGRHSQKPDHMYTIIEELCDGPYVELFARQRRQNWTSYGLEIDGRETAEMLGVSAVISTD